MKKAFTLVELIVVITILAILGTIAFINLQGYSMEARDSKRITDVNNTYKKITLERVKGVYPSNVMKDGVDTSTGLTIGGVIPNDSKQGKVNYVEIKEEEDNFKDPKGSNYVFSYAVGGSGTGAYKFVQLATINEQRNEAVVVGDYYKLETTDSESIVFSDPTNLNSPKVVNEQGVLPYEINTGGSSSLVAINGVCGSDDGGSFTSIPTNLCNAGTASSVTDNGGGNTYDWICNGINGGITYSCSANNTNLSQYPGCSDPDITYGSYTIAACNVGATIAGTDWTNSNTVGKYFQWGRNKGFAYGDSTQQSTTIAGGVGLDAGTDTYGFVWNSSLPGPLTWANTDITNNWGETTDTPLGTNISARQGPCVSGYHVPSQAEWVGIVTAGGWGTTQSTAMQTALKLPYAGFRRWDNGAFNSGGSNGYYWSSSPNSSLGYYLFFFSNNIYPSFSDLRALGFSVRCFKN